MKFAHLLCALSLVVTAAHAEVRIAPHLNNVSGDGVTFSWETTEPAGGSVELKAANGGPIIAELSDPGKINLLRVEGLKPDTEYTYILETDGETFTNSFKTAPVEPRPIRFCVIGDSRRWDDSVETTGMIDHILQWEPEFFIINGDLVYDGHVYEQWPEHFDRFGELVGKYMVASTRGNHEGSVLKDVENDWFGKYHQLPGDGEPFASFTWGNSHIVLLSWEQTVMPHLQPETANWLDEHLQSVDSQYVFVGQHFPIYCTGYYSPGDNRKETSENMRYQRDVMDKHDIDVHFAGHTHIYERHYPLRHQKRDDENGILYIVNGGDIGGNFPDWWTAVGDDPSKFDHPTYSAIICEEDQLEIRSFAWNKIDNEFQELDRVIRYEDEALPKKLLADLPDQRGEERIETINTLGAMMYGPAATTLLTYLSEDDVTLREATARALRSIGVEEGGQVKWMSLHDDSPVVRHEIARSFEIASDEMSTIALGPLVLDDKIEETVRIPLIGAMQFHAPQPIAFETMLKLLQKDGNSDRLRERAAYALTRVATEDHVDTLIDIFEQEKSTYVMVRAAVALNKLTGVRGSTNPNSRVYRAKPGPDREKYTKRWRESD